MKLSGRIRDLIRTNLSPQRWLGGPSEARSPAKLEAQLEQIRKSLIQAAGREKRLRDELLMAEQEGRERDAVRLRRELVDLSKSADELRSVLDLIEARIEMAREAKGHDLSPPSAVETKDLRLSESTAAREGKETDLASRKARLAAPEQKHDTKDGL